MSVNFSDVLCGIYLATIWIADLIFKDKFTVKERSWRSGPLCFTAFGLLIWFTILIQFVLIFLSLSQLMIVIHPVNTKFKRTGFVLKSVVSFIMLSFFCALYVNLSFAFSHGILSVSSCLSFIDPTNSVVMIKIITWTFIITQTGTATVLLVLYILLVRRLKESHKSIGQSKSNQDTDTALIIQLIVITTSNILSWFPVNGIYIAAIFLGFLSMESILQPSFLVSCQWNLYCSHVSFYLSS